jgi:hypothetical protein
MNRWRSLVIAVATVAVFASKPLFAIAPFAILVYGNGIEKPVMIRAGFPEPGSLGVLWWGNSGRFDVAHSLKGNPLVANLGDRKYLNLAIFWGSYLADQLYPENASQHGRLYLPTANAPALIVATMPDMRPVANPIPTDVQGFVVAWTLEGADRELAKNLGVPGLEPVAK